VKLLLQPADGAQPLIQAINGAKRRIEIVIFRFDHRAVERALVNAVERGVAVHALIAHTNRAGEKNLRKLELRLLAAGVTVARSADDLVRYHGKMMIIDRHELYLLAFNLTYQDIDHSRAFGVSTTSRDLVREALKVFDADATRHLYVPGHTRFVVSPVNARERLASFIKAARKDLLIYDPEVSDPSMIRLLEERSKAGVDIKLIGRFSGQHAGLQARSLSQRRLHTRTMVRDGQMAFIGSQSLRDMELDARRELGIIFRDRRIVQRLAQTFEEDWAAAEPLAEVDARERTAVAVKVAKRVAKAVSKDLPPVAPVLDAAIGEAVGERTGVEWNVTAIEGIVKDAVKNAVRETVKDVVQEVVESEGRMN
jgi:cardiolipin synthase